MPGLARPNGGELLRDWIKRSHYENQEKAAEALGYSAGFVSQLVTGERKPSLDVAADLYEKTGIPERSWVLSRLSKLKTGNSKPARKGQNLQTVKADVD